jgi:hypothetical protein
MRKFLIATVSVALAATSVAAIADTTPSNETGSFFINGNVGMSDFRVDNNSIGVPGLQKNDNKTRGAGALRVGYRWHSVVDYGVEAGYAYLGGTKYEFSNGADSAKTQQKSRGWLLGGNLNYNITDDWYVSARGGWYRSRNLFQGRVFTDGQTYRGSQSAYTGTGEYLGVGVGYNISKAFSVGVNYDNYHTRGNYDFQPSAHVAMYSLFGEYRF